MKKRDTGVNTLGFKEVSRTDKRLKSGLDTIIKVFSTEDKKTKRFETQEDLDREEKAIKLFTTEYGYTYKKLGDYDLDFLIKKKRWYCYRGGRSKRKEEVVKRHL